MTTAEWAEASNRVLNLELERVRRTVAAQTVPASSDDAELEAAIQTARAQAEAQGAPPTLDQLCQVLGLSPFERDVLLLCVDAELNENPTPTFAHALKVLPSPNWASITPAAPLRYWRLVEVGPGPTLSGAALRVDERILHYLAGQVALDARVARLVSRTQPAELVPSQQDVASRLVSAVVRASEQQRLAAVHLYGADADTRRAVAAAVGAELGLAVWSVPAQLLATEPVQLDAFMREWDRETLLGNVALLVEVGERDAANELGREAAIGRLCANLIGLVLVSSRDKRHYGDRPAISAEVRRPARAEQARVWQAALGASATDLSAQVEALVSQFDLSPTAIRAACLDADGPEALWTSARAQARGRFDALAERIDPVAAWEDLVLPESATETLQEIAAQVRQRARVYEAWGFASKSGRGLGISALFSGPSGTGKTMAAEVLARQLQIDLYRIDLSAMVSKYIGETEKNLRVVFDAAEDGGAILLFDEADALFGKRGEVKDSHDRYANVEVSYLLQRVEAYHGLAILTTNMHDALDPAFLRRIRFAIEFPFPDAQMRAEIWRNVFPSSTPTDGLDVEKLAQLNVAGGNIRSIAMNAAFLAASADEPVRMAHLARAARNEYRKIRKPLSDAELRGWI